MAGLVKPRIDGKGSEFGRLHRLLPASCCMFDMDKMIDDSGNCVNGEDSLFMEYRFNGPDQYDFKAMFLVV